MLLGRSRVWVLLTVLSPAMGTVPTVAETPEWHVAEGPTHLESQAVRLWWNGYQRQLSPVRRGWTEIARAIRRGRLDSLPLLCDRFGDSIERLDRERLLAVDDTVIRLYLGRGLDSLDRAITRCRQGRVFDLVHQLSQARSALLHIDHRFERYR